MGFDSRTNYAKSYLSEPDWWQNFWHNWSCCWARHPEGSPASGDECSGTPSYQVSPSLLAFKLPTHHFFWLRCSQSQLSEMDRQFRSCVKKIQYQVRGIVQWNWVHDGTKWIINIKSMYLGRDRMQLRIFILRALHYLPVSHCLIVILLHILKGPPLTTNLTHVIPWIQQNLYDWWNMCSLDKICGLFQKIL